MKNKVIIDNTNKNLVLNIALLVADVTGKSETKVKAEVFKSALMSKCFQ
ncbi:hypothetical protein [uncultured Clostridium sp.]|nr:hypothetical protein [uncultured Clostridium sp.]